MNYPLMKNCPLTNDILHLHVQFDCCPQQISDFLAQSNRLSNKGGSEDIFSRQVDKNEAMLRLPPFLR